MSYWAGVTTGLHPGLHHSTHRFGVIRISRCRLSPVSSSACHAGSLPALNSTGYGPVGAKAACARTMKASVLRVSVPERGPEIFEKCFVCQGFVEFPILHTRIVGRAVDRASLQAGIAVDRADRWRRTGTAGDEHACQYRQPNQGRHDGGCLRRAGVDVIQSTVLGGCGELSLRFSIDQPDAAVFTFDRYRPGSQAV